MKRLFVFISLLIIFVQYSFGYNQDSYPLKKNFFQLSENIFLSEGILKCSNKKEKNIELFSDTIKVQHFFVKSKIATTSCESSMLGTSYVYKKFDFNIYLIEDKDSVYRKKMLKEINLYYETKQDSFLKANYNQLDDFIIKSFELKNNQNLFPYFIDNQGETQFLLASLGNFLIKIELKNYKYLSVLNCKGKGVLEHFAEKLLYKMKDESLLPVFKGGFAYLSPKKREFYEADKLRR